MRRSVGLALGLMLALTLLGIAYAAWQSVLYINTTVTAADWGIAFVDDATYPSSNDPDTVVSVNEQGQLVIAVRNAYPGYSARVTFKIRNNGGLPVDLAEPQQISGPASGIVTFTWNNLPANSVPANGLSGELTVDIRCNDNPDLGDVIEPGETVGPYLFSLTGTP